MLHEGAENLPLMKNVSLYKNNKKVLIIDRVGSGIIEVVIDRIRVRHTKKDDPDTS